MQKTRPRLAANVQVTLFPGEGPPVRRVLDLGNGGWHPLTKELGWRTVALHPELGGTPWEIGLERVGSDWSDLGLRAASYLAGNADAGPLARMEIPGANVAWVANGMAARLGLTTWFTYVIEVLDRDDPRLTSWNEAVRDDVVMEATLPAGRAFRQPASGTVDLAGGCGPKARFGDPRTARTAEEVWTGGRGGPGPSDAETVWMHTSRTPR